LKSLQQSSSSTLSPLRAPGAVGNEVLDIVSEDLIPAFEDVVNAIRIDNYRLRDFKNFSLEPFEGRYVTKDDQDIAYIKADKFNVAYVMHRNTNTEEIDNHLKFLAAKFVHKAQYYDKKTKSRLVKVQMRPLAEKNFPLETNSTAQNYKFIVKGKVDPVKLHCVCNHPEVKGIHENLDLQCSKGKEKFHSECVKSDIENDEFVCTPCNLSSVHKGSVWSERKGKEWVRNSCPIDGSLTGLAIHQMERNPNIADNFPKDDAHTALSEALTHMRNGDSNEAQLTLSSYYQVQKAAVMNDPNYIKYQNTVDKIIKSNQDIEKYNKKYEKKPELQKKKLDIPATPIQLPYQGINVEKNNLFGEPRRLWADTFQSGSEFTFDVDCDTCEKHDTNVETSVPMAHMNAEDTAASFIRTTTYAGYTSKCPNNCKGTLIHSPLHPVGRPWLLSFDLQQMPPDQKHQIYEDITSGDMPTELMINNDTYQVSHITLNEEKVHFTSVHYDPTTNGWAFYDGQMDFVKTNSRKLSL